MYLWICYFAPVISQRYMKYTLVHSSKTLAYFSMSVLFRRSFKTAIFSRSFKVAIGTSNFMNEIYLYIYIGESNEPNETKDQIGVAVQSWL